MCTRMHPRTQHSLAMSESKDQCRQRQRDEHSDNTPAIGRPSMIETKPLGAGLVWAEDAGCILQCYYYNVFMTL